MNTDALRQEVAARIAERAATMVLKKTKKTVLRKQLGEARRHGLARRHATRERER